MNHPFVSCICPTYNRAPDYLWLLEEAVESFRQQEYPEDRRELLILNDAPGQTLSCDAPGVRVINMPGRIGSLGEKYNHMIALASGELICPWEDDDISLPNRIRISVERIGEAPYWNPKGYFFLRYQNGNAGSMSTDHPIGVSHNASIFRRDAWGRVNGYPHVSGAQDGEMDRRLSELEGSISKPSPKADWGYVYRWGVQPIHLSGRAPHDEFYRQIGEQDVAHGKFAVVPQWRDNYAALCNEAVA